MNSESHAAAPAAESEAAPSGRLRWSERVAYGCGDAASCLYFGIFMNFLSYYYTDIVGISVAAVGTMLLVVRTWDWVNDPIMGMIADRTRTRWGSFRPWILWMIPLWVLVGVLTFTTFDLSPGGQLVYAYVMYTLLTMVYTAINIPYSALMGVMTAKSEERTVLSSARFVGAGLGNLIVSSSMLYLIVLLGDGDSRRGFTGAVMVYAVLSAGLFLVTFGWTRERLKPPATQEYAIREDLRSLVRNRPWMILIVVSLLTVISWAVRGGSVIYYFKYCAGNEHLGTIFLSVSSAVQMAAVLFTKQIARLFGSKKAAFIFLMSTSAVLQSLFYFFDPGNITLIVAHQILSVIVSSPIAPLFWAMIADTADYGAWKLQHRSTGLLFSAGTFSQKIGWSIGPALSLWMLGAFGFVPNMDQGPETLHGLRLLMSLIPAGVSALVVITLLQYPINRRVEREMEAAVSREPSGAAG